VSLIHLILIILLLCAFILFYKRIDFNMWVTLICSAFILMIIVNPSLCISSTLSGAKLFFYKVFPSLFTFLIISTLIVSCNGVELYSKIFGFPLCRPLKLPRQCSLVLIISVLCGYPMGAKYCCELYENNYIDLETCQRLLNIATNASPIFLIGAVGTAMLKTPLWGYLLLISNILSCIFMSFILPQKRFNSIKKNAPKIKSENFGSILKTCIDNSIKNSLSIGGFVILFSVINSFIKSSIIFNTALNKISFLINMPKDALEGLLLGLIEMTNGCSLISSSSVNTYYKLSIISFLVSFSGASIITQVYSFTYKFDLSMKKYIFRKAVQGFISALISLVFYFIISLKPSVSVANFNINGINSYVWIISLLFLLLPLSIYAIKKLFNIS